MVLKDHSYLWSASKSPFIKYCWDKNNKDNDLDDHVSPLYKELLQGNFFLNLTPCKNWQKNPNDLMTPKSLVISKS